jgi:hypothetical protein
MSETSKLYLIKSKGFSFNNSFVNFPEKAKSFVILDPFVDKNGYFTKSEERYK